MRFRLKVFGLHLLASACALSSGSRGTVSRVVPLAGLVSHGGRRILIIVCSVDLALGPTLTLIIANPKKPRRTLARDIAIIAAVQLVALAYGTATLWQGRPLYYTFSARSIGDRAGFGPRAAADRPGAQGESGVRAPLVQPASLGLGAAAG